MGGDDLECVDALRRQIVDAHFSHALEVGPCGWLWWLLTIRVHPEYAFSHPDYALICLERPELDKTMHPVAQDAFTDDRIVKHSICPICQQRGVKWP